MGGHSQKVVSVSLGKLFVSSVVTALVSAVFTALVVLARDHYTLVAVAEDTASVTKRMDSVEQSISSIQLNSARSYFVMSLVADKLKIDVPKELEPLP